MKMKTRYAILLIAAALGAFAGPAFAQTPYHGQRPAPPAVAAQTALPECGFAATESWGPNGFQYCDARNVHDSGSRGGRSSW
jgi:hypothetical protein